MEKLADLGIKTRRNRGIEERIIDIRSRLFDGKLTLPIDHSYIINNLSFSHWSCLNAFRNDIPDKFSRGGGDKSVEFAM